MVDEIIIIQELDNKGNVTKVRTFLMPDIREISAVVSNKKREYVLKLTNGGNYALDTATTRVPMSPVNFKIWLDLIAENITV